MLQGAPSWRRLAYDAHHVPLLGGAIAGAYRRYFNNARGHVRLFRGLYPGFAAAAADIPGGCAVSYDNEASAARVLDEWLGVFPNDYPVLFWLAKLLRRERFVFDWGGNVGLKYFAYRRRLVYPVDHVWLVEDLPAVVSAGRALAQRESARALRFTTGFDELPDAGILLGLGVIQFLDDPFAPLRSAPRLPRHLLLNKVPVYDMPSALTLHNMGTAFCPYRLFNRADLLTDLEDLGYHLVDEWTNPDVSCEIPFQPEHSIGAYSGFYLTRTD